jgi:hypothetical protein
MTGLLRALRPAAWLLVIGLTAAAVAAIWVIFSDGELDDSQKVLGSSIGFAAASAAAAAGARATLRRRPALRMLGAVTVALAVIAFALLEVGLWGERGDDETLWRAFGCAAIAGVAGAHACLMLGSRKEGDPEAARLLISAAVTLGAIDALGAILPISTLVDDAGETYGQVFGSAFVLLLLTSVLPPLLRWLSKPLAGAKNAPDAA